jgi:3-oxoacyl-[acyl-carrier protein] reductase
MVDECWISYIRLTAPKEGNEVMEIDGKKVALGIPGAPRAAQATPDAYAHIPLKREGTVEEAAAGMLLCVAFNFLSWLMSADGFGSLASPLASYVNGHTLEVTGGAGI